MKPGKHWRGVFEKHQCLSATCVHKLVGYLPRNGFRLWPFTKSRYYPLFVLSEIAISGTNASLILQEEIRGEQTHCIHVCVQIVCDRHASIWSTETKGILAKGSRHTCHKHATLTKAFRGTCPSSQSERSINEARSRCPVLGLGAESCPIDHINGITVRTIKPAQR